MDQFKRLSDFIRDVVYTDPTLEFHARGIAGYVVFIRKIPADDFIRHIKNDLTAARFYFEKLTSRQSDFCCITPRSIGTDHVTHITSVKLQKSLDVKHLKRSYDQTIKQSRIIIPDLKLCLLYSHPNYFWIRFVCSDIDSIAPQLNSLALKSNETYIEELNTPNVYEFYIAKNYTMRTKTAVMRENVDRILTLLDSNDCDIIFCSELEIFNPLLGNKKKKSSTTMDDLVSMMLLFLSNFLKFMFCYIQNTDMFSLNTAEDWYLLNHLFLNWTLFLQTKNLSNMHPNTHSPLINYTAERPGVLLNKYCKLKGDSVITVEGSRPLMSTDKPSDINAMSTKHEFTHEVDLPNDIFSNLAIV